MARTVSQIRTDHPAQGRTRNCACRITALIAAFAVFAIPSPSFANDELTKQNSGQHEEVEIPGDLVTLKLSEMQHNQIKDVVSKYDRTIDAVWKQFRDRYMDTIKLESSMLASIEDSFTAPQRKHLREQRRKTAQDERATQQKTKELEQSATAPENNAKDDLAQIGVALTDEQESIAENIQRSYRSQFRRLNATIHHLHARLLSLESEKLADIEAVLTQNQRSEFRAEKKRSQSARQAETPPTKSD